MKVKNWGDLIFGIFLAILAGTGPVMISLINNPSGRGYLIMWIFFACTTAAVASVRLIKLSTDRENKA